MEEELLVSVTQRNCDHEKHRKYVSRAFDVLNGFELVASKCCNCHKTIELRIRKIA